MLTDEELDRMEKRAYRLENVSLDEISVVDLAANKGAQIEFWKNDHPRGDLIAKCSDAVSRGDLSGLTRADFQKALDQIAKRYPKRSGESDEKVYSRMLAENPVARDLYSGYVAARPSRSVIDKASRTDEANKLALAMADEIKKAKRNGKPISENLAMGRALRRHPELLPAAEADEQGYEDKQNDED